jgi:CxxC-x17-CxxC domain-containing protein
MSFEDKTLTCSDCDNSFTFTADEQEQFRAKGYTNTPKRCPDCRKSRKAEQLATGGNTFGARNDMYTPGRQMFPAVCSDCGKSTSVPFEPRQGRPVYCSDCYRKVRAGR